MRILKEKSTLTSINRQNLIFSKIQILVLLLLLFINISTGTSYQLQLTVFHISPT